MKRVAVGKQQSANTYLRTAPKALTSLYDYIGPGKEILWRLLTNPKMDKAWSIISSHVKVQIGSPTDQPYSKDSPNDPYRQLWSEIAQLLLRSRRLEKTWKAIDEDLGRIAKLAGDLRKEIVSSDREDEDKPPERRKRRYAPPKTGERFDHRSLEEYCPEIVKQINNQIVLPGVRDTRRGGVVEWPRLSEVLDELIAKIDQERKKEKERVRPVKRVRKMKATARNTEEKKKEEQEEINRRQRVFVVGLAQYLEHTFGLDRKSESIPVTAVITASVFKQKVLREFVSKALRGN